MQLDASQQRAVELGCTASFGVITGGPGTGKSTTLRVILDRFDEEGVSYALASPTGKAAKRMTEATGRPACTIHRLLGWTRYGWAHHANNPLEVDVVIIDESSMLDVELAAALVDALADHARLIMVGDANQLPSVGPGRVLADLVESGAVPVAYLTHVHRAAAESWICRNAPRVLNGEPLELDRTLPDFRYFEVEDAGEAARMVGRIVTMPEFAGAQVLAPQRNTACGVEGLNAQLQAQLNPARAAAAEWKLGDTVLRQGDRVIQTTNNYKLVSTMGTLGVFNGEVGEIVEVGDLLTVDFGDRKVPYTKGDALALDLAYALTTHKFQGSECPWVVFVVHSSHTYMLTRQLFYTAITRAKKGVVLVGNAGGLRAATSAKTPPKRNTTLIARMLACESDNDNADGADDADDEQEKTSW